MPISRQLTIFFVCIWIATVAILGTLLVGYRIQQTELLLAESEQKLVAQRAHEIQYRFDEISTAHTVAEELQKERFDRLKQSEVDRKFQAAFVPKADGTWRSRDFMFDGGIDPVLGRVSGIAGYIAPGVLDFERKRYLVAVLDSIISVSPGQRGLLESLWHVSPYGDILIFAPEREDRLLFYRESAPAKSDFLALPFVQAALPENNPGGKVTCTSLSRAVFDPSGKTLITSCQTPTIVARELVGVWGTSLLMNERLTEIVQRQDDRTIALAGSDGTLIAAPGMLGREVVSASIVESVRQDLHWPHLLADLAGSSSQGIISKPNLPSLVAYARIQGPNWLLVHLRDRAEIARQLFADWPLLLAMSLLLLLLQVGLVLWFIGSRIAGPLKAITATYPTDVEFEIARARLRGRAPTEISTLAEQLASAWSKIQGHVIELEHRVADRTVELSGALREAEATNRAMTVLLANVSHEIRTPLNAVVAMSGVLLRADLPAAQHEMARLILSSSETLKTVVSDILDASKLESGRLALVIDAFDLATSLDDVCAGFAIAAREEGLSLVVDHDSRVQGWFLGDSHRLSQIIGNLVSNGIKFTEQGGVTVTTRCVEQQRDATLVEIAVSDTGSGFSPEFAQRLFGRFEQADDAVTRRLGGTGLGLSISRALAELMGGTLSATSEPGKGSCFTLRVPLVRTSPPSRQDPADRWKRTTDVRRSISVLVVEDHPRNQQVMMILLDQIGASTTIAASGKEALQLANETQFDLILMDMQLPDMDGNVVTMQLRTEEMRRSSGLRTPIIMVTANAAPENAAAALAAGCDAHLAKPVLPETLYRTIDQLLH